MSRPARYLAVTCVLIAACAVLGITAYVTSLTRPAAHAVRVDLTGAVRGDGAVTTTPARAAAEPAAESPTPAPTRAVAVPAVVPAP
ncbi:hypothetical protein [Pseudonocardia zijingensis]|uniref:hypothetical protein n=1 Tax=Pseudonocardia zijingensis TaxID=153376 RepID=UPI0036151255